MPSKKRQVWSASLTWFLRKWDSRHRPRDKEMYLELITGSRSEGTEVEMERKKIPSKAVLLVREPLRVWHHTPRTAPTLGRRWASWKKRHTRQNLTAEKQIRRQQGGVGGGGKSVSGRQNSTRQDPEAKSVLLWRTGAI